MKPVQPKLQKHLNREPLNRRFLTATLLAMLLTLGIATQFAQANELAPAEDTEPLNPYITVTDQTGGFTLPITDRISEIIDFTNPVIRGEWETAGAPSPPYEPSYRYRYVCQIELSEGEWKIARGNDERFKIIGVARFTVDSKPTWIDDFTKLNWHWLKYTGSDEEARLNIPTNAHKTPISLAGHFVGVSIVRGKNPATDIVRLSITAALPVRDYYVSRTEFKLGSRKDAWVSGEANVSARRSPQAPQSTPERLSRKLYVSCQKHR